MMLSWDGENLPDGSKITVAATDTDNEVYTSVITISGDKAIEGGKMNSITGVKLALSDFVYGDGPASATGSR